MTITVTVHLHNALRRRTPAGWQNRLSLTLPAHAAVRELIERLQLDFPREALLVVVDRRAVSEDHLLQDGDVVHLLPALSGGSARHSYTIPYGRGELSFSLPVPAEILSPRRTPAARDPLSVVRAALADPVGDVSLADFVHARRVAIAVSDQTRPVPYRYLLPPLFATLAALGIADERIMLIIANGAHPPMPPARFRAQVHLSENIAVVSHDCDDTVNLVYCGETAAGTPVWVNRHFHEADLRIVVGNIEPHQFQGYSGGAKGAAIGLAGRETIDANHSLMTHPDAQLGRYDDNPARQDVEAIGRAMGIHFALNAILNQDKQLVSALAGEPIAVMRAGIPQVGAACQVRVEHPFDLVVASPGGHPKDINLYQAQKALAHAALVTRDGGFVILVAACPQGTGSPEFETWVRQRHSLQDVLSTFAAEGFRVGPHKAVQLARDARRVQVRLVSEMEPAQVRSLLLTPAPDLDSALREALTALPSRPRIAIMPQASATAPILDAARPASLSHPLSA